MTWAVSGALAVVAFMVATAISAWPAPADHAWETCQKESGDLSINACTAAVYSGKYKGPDLAKLYRWRGNRYDEKNDFEHAIADLNEAIRLDPKNHNFFLSRALVWENKGDFDRSITDLNEAIRLAPNIDARSFHYYARGNVWQRKDYDRAIADYTEAIRLDPKYEKAFYNRAVTWSDKGDLDRSLADYDAAIRLAPKNAGYRNTGVMSDI